VIGVSTDSEKSHQKFISKFQLPFDLLADTDKKIVNDYGVWGEKSMYGKKYMGTNRKTFLIDEQGKIAKIFDKVNVSEHADEVLEAGGVDLIAFDIRAAVGADKIANVRAVTEAPPARWPLSRRSMSASL